MKGENGKGVIKRIESHLDLMEILMEQFEQELTKIPNMSEVGKIDAQEKLDAISKLQEESKSKTYDDLVIFFYLACSDDQNQS